MTPDLLGFAASSGVILGLVQAVKIAGLPARWAPILAVAFGAAGGPFVFAGDLAAGVVAGVVAGLSAVGLYSTVAHTTPAGEAPAADYLRSTGPDRFGNDPTEG